MSRGLIVIVVVLIGFVQTARADDAVGYKCRRVAPSTKLSVTFKPETEITDLVTWVMGFTCKNIVLDAEVTARVPKVTVLAPNEMTPKQGLQLFIDAVEATGLVVVVKKDTIQIKLGAHMRSCPSVAASPSRSSSPPPPPPPSANANTTSEAELQRLVDNGIKKISDTQFEISAQLIDAILADPISVGKGARVVPAVKDGKPDGFKIYAVRPSSVYAKIGLMNGDTLRAINGYELTSADKALEVYTKLRDASSLSLDLIRRGKPITITITIK